jgi:hypothetical protein
VATGFTLVTGADGTKGVILPAAAAGKQVEIKNGGQRGPQGLPRDRRRHQRHRRQRRPEHGRLTSALFTAYDATTWYTTPLVPS